MAELNAIAPSKKERVMDAVRTAGVDVSDWANFKGGNAKAAVNPKYCYEWAFIEPSRVVVLNLWHTNNQLVDGRVIQKNNFRRDEANYRSWGKGVWAKRARKIDDALQQAVSDNLPVRVILLDGKMRDRLDADATRSEVTFRQLDPELWTITSYDFATGENTIARGITTDKFVDQFSIDQIDKGSPDRRDVTTSAFVRDPQVRRDCLRRAQGRCENCGSQGFKTPSGALYLETHHIQPLAEGGADTLSNVIALCPNDHRRAHYGLDTLDFRDKLYAAIESK
ncbi:HNH endonuclease [Henriciella mobilis]|uniref:HNH endonuclease n=1 Tax=Henriciella mobilis TaxID=2305467 RepID=UPI000E665381|nr:HNH endonuclease [Henriciella mobilis]RIJ17142.1 HNH endonuclease [Henriciella mobilis]RIJ22749.1 HNH endonuclease [Henriciella mobilis]